MLGVFYLKNKLFFNGGNLHVYIVNASYNHQTTQYSPEIKESPII